MLRSDGPLSLYAFLSASRPQRSAIVSAPVVISIIYVYHTPFYFSYIVTKILPGYYTPTLVNRTKLHMLNYCATSTFNHGLYDSKSLLPSNLEDYGIAILLVFGSATRQLDVRCGPPIRFT